MPVDIKRALRDRTYLDSLTKDELKECIELVAGSQTLDDEELDRISGGRDCNPMHSGLSKTLAC
jgi:hypothetical protein